MKKRSSMDSFSPTSLPTWAMAIRGVCSLLVLIVLILGILSIIPMSVAVSTILILVGGTSIWTAIVISKAGIQSSAKTTGIAGIIVIAIGIINLIRY